MVTIAGDNGIYNTASKNVSLQREGHGGGNAGGGEIVDTNVPIFLDDTFEAPPQTLLECSQREKRPNQFLDCDDTPTKCRAVELFYVCNRVLRHHACLDL